MFTQQPLVLSGKEPLVKGSHRLLFQLDEHPDLLVKVMREKPKKAKTFIKRLKLILIVWKKHGRFRFLFREYKYYIRTKLIEQERQEPLPISEVRGLIITDIGLGMLTEKVSTKDNELAPSLTTLARTHNLTPYIPQLNDFVRRMYDWNIVANDINSGNVVLGVRNDQTQFILIDGLGDSHLIPVRTWFPFLNRRSLNKRFRTVAEVCKLEWDSKSRTFSEKYQAAPEGEMSRG